MLHDRATIRVEAGRGGDGCLSFRREAHVPKGGPDGGDGGRGGDVVVVCDGKLRDLSAFRRRRRYAAGRGGHGEGAKRQGADGQPLEIPVPPGTVVSLPDGGELDMVVPGDRVVIARGGKGGRGNAHFASATRQAPRFRERGLSGAQVELTLQLKLLADVGFVGLPNAGKSSLLAALTRARPKVADYPFTTLEPVLGTLQVGDRQLVLADIPGLIEGASSGAGLGHDFLGHIERTRLIVHVLDGSPLDGSEPIDNHAVIEAELAAHDPVLAALPRVLVLSKSDLLTDREAALMVGDWQRRVGAGVPVIATSAATGAGIRDLGEVLARKVPDSPVSLAAEIPAGRTVYRPAPGSGWEVGRSVDGSWQVTGRGIERLVERFDLDDDDALAELESRLRSMGVMRELEARGLRPGEDVEIAGIVFELDAGVD